MAISITGIVALVLTVTGVGLLASGGILTEFVDVFIVEDVDNPTSGEPLAGVGIFSAVYDASVLSEDTLSESGVPDDEFETPTLSFPLLFPCQENFVLDVLPIQAADVESFGSDLLTAGVQSAVDLVDIGFEDCESYTTDIFPAISAYWTLLEAALFPEIFAAFDAAARASVGEQGFEGIGTGLEDAVTAALEECTTLDSTVADSALCLAGIESTGVLVSTYSALCEETDTIEDCFITKTSYDLVDADLTDTLEFTLDDDDVGDVCDVLLAGVLASFGLTCDAATNAQYITALIALAEASGQNETVTSLELYQSFSDDFVDGSLSSISSLSSAELAIDTNVTSLISNSYAGCETLVLLGAADANCTFVTYLPTAVALSGDSTIEALSSLYTACFGFFAADDSTCPEVFGRIVVDGALQGDLALDDFGGLASEAVAIARALETCQNNDIDNEKIAQSQTFVIVAYIAHSIAVLAGVAGLLLDAKVATFSIAGVAAIAGGFLTFGALLTVQSAPVYDGVGGEAEEFEAIFVEGKVVAIALADFLIMIVAGITFFVAAYLGRGAGSAAEEPEEEEKKEVVAAKAAEPEEELEVAEVKAEEETKEDVVPGTNVAI